MIRIRHPKTGRTLRLKIPPDITVQPHRLKAYTEAVLGYFEKITDHFTVNMTLELVLGTDWRTANKYLKILEYNDIVKFSQGPPYPSYILACETSVEEFQAEAESIGSILAAVAYDRVKAFGLRRPVVASVLLHRLSRLANRLPLVREEGLIPAVRECLRTPETSYKGRW